MCVLSSVILNRNNIVHIFTSRFIAASSEFISFFSLSMCVFYFYSYVSFESRSDITRMLNIHIDNLLYIQIHSHSKEIFYRRRNNKRFLALPKPVYPATYICSLFITWCKFIVVVVVWHFPTHIFSLFFFSFFYWFCGKQAKVWKEREIKNKNNTAAQRLWKNHKFENKKKNSLQWNPSRNRVVAFTIHLLFLFFPRSLFHHVSLFLFLWFHFLLIFFSIDDISSLMLFQWDPYIESIESIVNDIYWYTMNIQHSRHWLDCRHHIISLSSSHHHPHHHPHHHHHHHPHSIVIVSL